MKIKIPRSITILFSHIQKNVLITLFTLKKSKKYYFIVNKKKKGPFSMAELFKFKINEETMIWKPGASGWKSLKNSEVYKYWKIFTPPPEFPPCHKVTDALTSDSKYDITSVEEESEVKNNARFWQRTTAICLDMIFLGIIFSIFFSNAKISAFGNIKESSMPIVFLFINPLGIFICWLFFALFESSSLQATPGKVLMGLIVTDKHLNRVPFSIASIRFIGKLMSSGLLGIGYLLICFKKMRCLHDYIANTYVIVKHPENINRKKPIIALTLICMVVLYILILTKSSIGFPYISNTLKNIKSENSSNKSESKGHYTIEEIAAHARKYVPHGLHVNDLALARSFAATHPELRESLDEKTERLLYPRLYEMYGKPGFFKQLGFQMGQHLRSMPTGVVGVAASITDIEGLRKIAENMRRHNEERIWKILDIDPQLQGLIQWQEDEPYTFKNFLRPDLMIRGLAATLPLILMMPNFSLLIWYQ